MKKTILKAFFALSCIGFSAQAQVIHKNERYVKSYNWKVGASYNMMDFNFNHTDLPEGASMISGGIPAKVMIGYEFAPNFSVEADFSMNEMEKDNVMNGMVVNENISIVSFNGSLAYSLGGLFNIPIADPYIKAGVGHLRLNETDLTMASAGGGINFWIADIPATKSSRYHHDKFYRRLGINVEAMGRSNISTKGQGSHAQYSAGVFYVF
ncbi:porin family protein [Flavobacterium sp. CBA20B-1]|uniref:Porin family protein n=1 Tax=Paenimyroides aestuarii TaxID=2968490 RepID=A0ABY5NRG7_9FLAO|nr:MULTISPECIES: porin family protein [Flavobacteriaceae]UUV21123.1 porin family protein [Paenimyroides aestuarii]WCM42643.1 porin family protein [Flavobacterium sp. CBA20B-1]